MARRRRCIEWKSAGSEQAAQLSSSAVEPGNHGSNGGAHDLSDLPAPEAFDVGVITAILNCSGSAFIAAVIALSGIVSSASSSAERSPVDVCCACVASCWSVISSAGNCAGRRCLFR